MAKSRSKSSSNRGDEARRRVKLKPHDSFDLIRLLAASQTDARKAVGELVQNALDANARHVEITWLNEKAVRCLRVRDDGEGIFPSENRLTALQTIAQTIGHSHKRKLTPLQRREEMTLGKYGIGLLGFWCVARHMEIRSRVGGGEVWSLLLEEDQPDAEVVGARATRLHEEGTFTEITLRFVKDSVVRQIRPARLQAFLASELRGQLLQRGVEVRIHDRVARGTAIKEFVVQPRAYLGIALDEFKTLAVSGHEDARLELYYVPPDEGRRGTVLLSCGGTTVLDDLALVDLTDPTEGTRAPWNTGLFEGVIDFPELEVAPGSRRGFMPNEAALDFLLALERLEQQLAERIRRDEETRAAERRENVSREIRRVFATVARRLPQYDMFDVKPASDTGTRDAGSGGQPSKGAELVVYEQVDPPESSVVEGDVAGETERDAPSLFPPGPLASVRITPSRARVAPAQQRTLRAVGRDSDGRACSGEPLFEWKLVGPGRLAPARATAVFTAPQSEGEASIEVVAHDGAVSVAASARIEIRESVDSSRTSGIPEPQPVNAPSERWRSRVRGERWEYNEGHPDCLAVRGDETRRLRYLCHLFAKEVVLKNSGDPGPEEVLERMVEILTHLGDARVRSG